MGDWLSVSRACEFKPYGRACGFTAAYRINPAGSASFLWSCVNDVGPALAAVTAGGGTAIVTDDSVRDDRRLARFLSGRH